MSLLHLHDSLDAILHHFMDELEMVENHVLDDRHRAGSFPITRLHAGPIDWRSARGEIPSAPLPPHPLAERGAYGNLMLLLELAILAGGGPIVRPSEPAL